MTTMSAAPPLFLLPLADRSGASAGLLLACAEGDAGDWPLDALQALAAGGPCFYRLPCAAAPALQQAGWQALPAGAVARLDDGLDRDLPPAIAWLEGDWYLAPPPKPIGQQAASRALALRLVQLVNADADNHEIEAVLRQDPTLSYHLLRLVNSLGVGGGRRVSSFSQAILILGRQQLRRWLNLMLFASRADDPRASMLLSRAALRAHAMELLARCAGLNRTDQDQAFMAGMFSLLGALFGLALDELLQPLVISDAVRAALLARDGELGALLALVEQAERGDFAALSAGLAALQIDVNDYNRCIADATLWMQGVAAGAGRSHA
ncbi:EAL and HDOD domain-containing protein [Rugamonas sp.]|uniref:EAL and HDOD domain-containing protein n=1 Tax=Rugamonas sp. TaxID=1926287 RepID=UPI0025ED204A|nr:HDOD domain-containing protein [Rugamonas sp.]